MEIGIESPSRKFDDHLTILESNNRILFSGKFGTGKSHFLKKYFEKNKSRYNLFWLSPVDYVVGNNQDIFEWIKMDIAKELLASHFIDNTTEKFGKNLLVQTYLYNSIGAIFTALLTKVSGELSKKKTGVDFLDGFNAHLKGFKDFEKRVKEES